MGKITRFERARLITARALQLSFGAPPLVKALPEMTFYELAINELQEGALPLVVVRHFPSGQTEKVAF